MSRLVYSSDSGRMCPECRKPIDECICKKKTAPASDGVIRVRRETKGRHGKTVTTVTGAPLGEDALQELASDLKRRCGTGGSAKDGVIVIQGDHCDEIITLLKARGYAAKRTGG